MAEVLKLDKSNFSKWYDDVLRYAEILDDRYPLKGVGVWMPYGFKALKLMMRIMENKLDETGHQDSYFPIFAPASIFAKEADFLKGFMGEALRATKIGRRDLDEELVVRPTSETIMYYMYSMWIRSWRDLPLKLYQVVPIFRWETKMTRPLLRVRELAKFKEAHTAHATAKEAEKQIAEGIDVYKQFYDVLKIPYVILKTPEWDTFAGALYNYDFFTVMPDGKGIELASVINLGQKFAKAFDIKFRDKDKKEKYVHQTCYGISERTLGAAISIHGDDKGLRFTSDIAPIQVIIIPILGSKQDKKVLAKCKELKKKLERQFRVDLDLNLEKTAGEKFYHWEVKGVPIRLEVGPRDLEDQKVTLVRRDNKQKTQVLEPKAHAEIEELLNKVNETLNKEGKAWLKSMITIAKDEKDAKAILDKKGGIVKLLWCGESKCGQAIEAKLAGGALGINEKEAAKGKCVKCGKTAKFHLHFARTY